MCDNVSRCLNFRWDGIAQKPDLGIVVIDRIADAQNLSRGIAGIA